MKAPNPRLSTGLAHTLAYGSTSAQDERLASAQDL